MPADDKNDPSTPPNSSNAPDPKDTARVKVVFAAAAIILLLLHGLHFSIFAHPDIFTIGVLIAAALPWLLSLLSSAELPGGWKLQFRAVANKVDNLEDKTKDAMSQVAQLYALSMSDYAYTQLKRLHDRSFVGYQLYKDRTIGLGSELCYLKVLGYIEFKSGKSLNGKKICGVEDLPVGLHDSIDLSQYISVTPQGEQFIKLREATAKNIKPANAVYRDPNNPKIRPLETPDPSQAE